MQIVNFQAEKTKFPARLSSDTRTGEKSPLLLSHRRRHSVLHAVVLLSALGVVEAVERTHQIARDAANPLERHVARIHVCDRRHERGAEDAGERVAVVVRPGGSVMLRSDRHILRIHIVLHIRATL